MAWEWIVWHYLNWSNIASKIIENKIKAINYPYKNTKLIDLNSFINKFKNNKKYSIGWFWIGMNKIRFLFNLWDRIVLNKLRTSFKKNVLKLEITIISRLKVYRTLKAVSRDSDICFSIFSFAVMEADVSLSS